MNKEFTCNACRNRTEQKKYELTYNSADFSANLVVNIFMKIKICRHIPKITCNECGKLIVNTQDVNRHIKIACTVVLQLV